MALQVCLCERVSANVPLQRALMYEMPFAKVRNAFHYTNRCFSGPKQAIPSRATSNKVVLSGGLELTRLCGQSTAFTRRQVNEVPQNVNGPVNGILLRSSAVIGIRQKNGADRGCTSPQ